MSDPSRRARVVILSLLLILLLATGAVVGAQEAGNLLVNGHMEGGFSERDGVTGVPLGWAFYAITGAPDADRQAFAPYAYSPPTFWTIRSSYTNWVAGGFQNVTVTPGITYRFAVYVFIWTCDDNVHFCTSAEGRFSNPESNARARVGIDPNGASDPNSAAIVWGPWVQSFDRYQGISVDAAAVGDRITVFLQGDSGQAMAFNEVYWDSATLVPVTTAPADANQPAAADTVSSAVPPISPDQFVPFVNPQQARPDGSVVHVVQAGDTFLSILVAYTDLGITRESVMQLNGWRFEPNFINIGEEIVILPPGSVDASTGQVIGGAVATAPQPAQAEQEAAPPVTSEAAADTLSQTQPVAALRTLTLAEVAGMPPVESIPQFLPR